MSDIDRIKEKLAKLLRLGENDAASEGEIQNALNLATAMMAKHQLTREDIETSAPDPIAKVQLGRHMGFFKSSTVSTWENELVHFVCNFIGTVTHYQGGKQPVRRNGITDFFGDAWAGEANVREAAVVYFYGCDEDARCAVSMFEELRDSIATMALIRWGGWARKDGAAYAFGFTQGLEEARVCARRNLMNTDATTTALMLRSESTSLAIVDKSKLWLHKTHGVRIRSVKRGGIRLGDGQAHAAGKRDGANYNPTRPGSRQRLA